MKVIYQSDDGRMFEAEEECRKYEEALKREIEFYKKSGIWQLVTSKDKKYGYDGYFWLAINRASGHLGEPWQKGIDPEINALNRCREFICAKYYLTCDKYYDIRKRLTELGVDLEMVKENMDKFCP